MQTLILLVVAAAFLALIEAGYYGVRYSGERRRAELRRRLQMLREESTTSLLREQRIAHHPEVARILQTFPITKSLEQLLLQTDLRWTVAGLLGAGVGATLTLLAALLLFDARSPLAWLVLPMGMFAPWLPVLVARSKRNAALSAQLPDALDMVVRAMRAGHGVGSAFKMVAAELPVPIAAEFARCCEESNMGVELRIAIQHMNERCPNNLDLKIFAVSVGLQFETGGNLVELLEQIATTIRERFRFYGKVAALTAEGKLSGLILGALPFATAGMMAATNPEYLRVLIVNPTGHYFLGAALGLWAMGVVSLYRLTKLDY